MARRRYQTGTVRVTGKVFQGKWQEDDLDCGDRWFALTASRTPILSAVTIRLDTVPSAWLDGQSQNSAKKRIK